MLREAYSSHFQENEMEVMNAQEIDQVSGGVNRVAVAATLTLMGMAAASPVVIGVGGVALICHFLLT